MQPDEVGVAQLLEQGHLSPQPLIPVGEALLVGVPVALAAEDEGNAEGQRAQDLLEELQEARAQLDASELQQLDTDLVTTESSEYISVAAGWDTLIYVSADGSVIELPIDELSQKLVALDAEVVLRARAGGAAAEAREAATQKLGARREE